MKRLLIIISMLFLCAASVFAYSEPRWRLMPLTVYVPDVPQSAVVEKAYKSWQTSSNGLVRFICGSRNAAKRGAHITIEFIDILPQKQYYEIESDIFNSGFTTHKEFSLKTGFYYRVRVKIRTLDEENNVIPDDKLYAIALQAAGRSLGVDYVKESGNAMSYNFDFDNSKITNKDIQALIKVYK